MSADGRITEWNRQAEIAFGWSRAEVVGRSHDLGWLADVQAVESGPWST
jgi:PAS domain S-box-containing protein